MPQFLESKYEGGTRVGGAETEFPRQTRTPDKDKSSSSWIENTWAVTELGIKSSINFIGYALPAWPTWMIPLVLCSSLLSVGQLSPSAFTSVISSLVPMILYVDWAVSICPNNGSSVLYLLLSAVGRSRTTAVWLVNSTFARSLWIFFRNKLAITLVGVW